MLKLCREAPEGAGFIGGRTQDTIKRNIVDELINIFGDKLVRYYPGKRELYMAGRTIYLIGASDERAETKIRGGTFSFALMDEVTLLPQSFVKMGLSRLSRPGAQMICTTNPDSPFHWFKKEFMDDKELDIKIFKFLLTDNPSLDPNFINQLKKEYKGLWYKRYIEGLWCLAEGTIYDFFDESIHVVNEVPFYAKYYICGIDYGTSNACCFTLIGFNDDQYPNIWVEKEYYFDSRKEGYQKTDAEYADDLYNFLLDYPVKYIYIDPSAASFNLELRRKGLPVREAKNDVLNGIRTVALHLSTGNLKIHYACNNLIKEFQSYVWDSKKSDKGLDMPLKINDHALDALRYAIYTHFGEKKNLKEKNAEDRMKESFEKSYRKNPMAYVGWGPGWQKL